MFGRAGYTATSLSDVALAAEISEAGLLHHFDSKEELFSAVLERRDTEDLKWFEGDTESVWTFLDRFAEVIDNNASRPGMVGLYTAMTMGALDRDHPAHPWLHQHLTRSVDYLAEQFERGKAQGSVDPEAPSYELARTVVSCADGIQLQWLCARADAVGDNELQPVHGEAPLDMARPSPLAHRTRARAVVAHPGGPPLTATPEALNDSGRGRQPMLPAQTRSGHRRGTKWP